MKKLRHIVRVEANRENFGVFTTFKAAYDTLIREGFEIKSYRYQLRVFSAASEVRLYCVKRKQSFYSIKFLREIVNSPLLPLN